MPPDRLAQLRSASLIAALGGLLATGCGDARSTERVEDPCGRCHAAPPATLAHVGQTLSDCFKCHPGTVADATGALVPGGTHLNGAVDVSAAGGGACDRCHGAPPDTGVHRTHATPPALGAVAYGDQSVTEDVDPTGAGGRYYFGCGMCHPTDPAKHGSHTVDLSPGSGVAGGLKSRNRADAAYTPDPAVQGEGTCSGVACHSSGQATSPAFAVTPRWTSGAGTLGCGGCHGNPPSYPNGGPDSSAANGHIGLDYRGSESGHVFGLPGPNHKSRHGLPTAYAAAQRAAPTTCQTCHAATVDPANVAPGGFFYLDTSITTSLVGDPRYPAGDTSRVNTAAWKDLQCAGCHDGQAGSPAAGTGRVLPLRHVNGKADVVFDARTALPAGYLGGVLGAQTPTRPYYWTNYSSTMFGAFLPAGATLDGAATPTISMELSGASYDPATKTCSSVACHFQQPSVRWGGRQLEAATLDCRTCHTL